MNIWCSSNINNVSFKSTNLNFLIAIQVYEDKIWDIIYKYIEDYLTEAAKEFRFNKNLKLNFKWTPDIHIKILNVLDQLEQKYKTKIRISANHIDKNKGIDRFSEKVFKLLLNDDIKLYKNSDIDLPINRVFNPYFLINKEFE